MKRAGNLMKRIAEMGNLRQAFLKARKGKEWKAEVLELRSDLDSKLSEMRRRLIDETLLVGDYHYFTIHDPKERRICAASFLERVLHHAIMNVCEPEFERVAIHDSYACRRGKGLHKAVGCAINFVRNHAFFLKMDIGKYFDSIDHDVLLEMLTRRFKDRALMRLFQRIIHSYQTAPGKGLPIGNLTSQHFANFYLGAMDRHVKESLHCRGYLRYMDDFIVFGDRTDYLKGMLAGVKEYLHDTLKLRLKEMPFINRTRHGLEFLGLRLLPDAACLTRSAKRRFLAKWRRNEAERASGGISELDAQRRATSLFSYVEHARTLGLRLSALSEIGVARQGAPTA